MRNKLRKLLKKLENQDEFINEYEEYDHNWDCVYHIRECLALPNYRFILSRFYKEYPKTISIISTNMIKNELRRMEIDGIIAIETQKEEVGSSALAKNNEGPDFDVDTYIGREHEGIFLTTRGRSLWRFWGFELLHNNPIATLLAIASTIISIIALK